MNETWRYVAGYVAALAVFLFLDMLWLGVIARDYYRIRLKAVVDMHVSWSVAFVFYALHIAGLFLFVVSPAMNSESSLGDTVLRGALYGFFTYATYDLTNWATVRAWPAGLALVDMTWGAVLNACVTLAGMVTLRWLPVP